MAQKTVARIKHVPQRTCVGCRKILAKRSLIRIVRTATGVQIDPTGKLNGRGAYLHEIRSCWEQGLKGPIANALHVNLTAQDIEILRDFALHLPDSPMEEG